MRASAADEEAGCPPRCVLSQWICHFPVKLAGTDRIPGDWTTRCGGVGKNRDTRGPTDDLDTRLVRSSAVRPAVGPKGDGAGTTPDQHRGTPRSSPAR